MLPSAQTTAFDAAASGKTHYASVAHDFDALRAVLVFKVLRDIRRHDAIHDAIRHFQNRDPAAHPACRRRDFQADVAAADDDYARSGLQARSYGRGIVDVAQIVHSGEIGSGTGHASRQSADTQQETVVIDFLAARQGHAARGGIDADCASAEPELDGMLVVEAAMAKQQPFRRQLTRQEFLRQRRPLIGQHALIADQDQPAFESFAAQSVDGLGACLSTPHDDNRRNHGRHISACARSSLLRLASAPLTRVY